MGPVAVRCHAEFRGSLAQTERPWVVGFLGRCARPFGWVVANP